MANEEPVLFSLKDSKAAISKQKIVEVTKTAMNALRFYKHVVLIVEKFIQKCDPILKVPSFYIIDSIVRQGIKQHKEKDVFGPRFALNLTKTLEKGLECSEEDKLKIVRVINLWRTHNVFQPNVIDSLLNYCRSIGLDVDVKSVEMKVKGDKANMKIYSQEDRKSKRSSSPQTPPKQNEVQQSSQEVAHSDVAPLNGISEKEISERLQQTFPQWASLIDSNQETFQRFFQSCERVLERTSGSGESKPRSKHFGRQYGNDASILTQDFEYSDDEDEKQQKVEFNVPKDKIESMVNEIFSDANFRASTAGIYTSTLTANKPPQLNQFPDVSNIFANKPPPMPVSNPWHPFQPNVFLNPFAPDQNTIPMPVQSPVKSQQSDSIKCLIQIMCFRNLRPTLQEDPNMIEKEIGRRTTAHQTEKDIIEADRLRYPKKIKNEKEDAWGYPIDRVTSTQ
ncbi:CID domain-containing protein [Aphelenchoides bicaudatus]|nr:CID domain-containing protein [Aphelenchoides bicaudatus]